jgi:hypothetical protein
MERRFAGYSYNSFENNLINSSILFYNNNSSKKYTR